MPQSIAGQYDLFIRLGRRRRETTGENGRRSKVRSLRLVRLSDASVSCGLSVPVCAGSRNLRRRANHSFGVRRPRWHLAHHHCGVFYSVVRLSWIRALNKYYPGLAVKILTSDNVPSSADQTCRYSLCCRTKWPDRGDHADEAPIRLGASQLGKTNMF